MEIIIANKEQKIQDLKQIAFKVDSQDYHFTEKEWEYIHEALIQEAFNLQFKGDKKWYM